MLPVGMDIIGKGGNANVQFHEVLKPVFNIAIPYEKVSSYIG